MRTLWLQRKCVWFEQQRCLDVRNIVLSWRSGFHSSYFLLVVQAHRSACGEPEQKIVFISVKRDNEARYDIAPSFSFSIYFLSRRRERRVGRKRWATSDRRGLTQGRDPMPFNVDVGIRELCQIRGHVVSPSFPDDRFTLSLTFDHDARRKLDGSSKDLCRWKRKDRKVLLSLLILSRKMSLTRHARATS